MKPIELLTDQELSHELTEVRIALESFGPYRCHQLSVRQRELWAEYDRRLKPREIALGVVEFPDGTYRCNI